MTTTTATLLLLFVVMSVLVAVATAAGAAAAAFTCYAVHLHVSVSHFSSMTNLQLLYDVITNSVGKLNNPVHDAFLQHKPDHHSSLLGCDAGSLAKCFPVFCRAMMSSLSRVKHVKNRSPNDTVSHPRRPESSAVLL